MLSRVRERAGVPILTDIHEAAHAEPVAEVADVLQIPAFLSRQTDLLEAAARTGRVVNLKKGQFLAPTDIRHAIEKITAAGNQQVIVTERGFTFGYHNLVVDMRAFPIMRAFGYPVVYDVTHSLQLPGAGDGVTAGQAEFIEPLASAGVAAGVDGVFLEVHEQPSKAEATRRTRSGWTCSSPCSSGWFAFMRSRRSPAEVELYERSSPSDVGVYGRSVRLQPDQRRHMSTDTASALDLARKVLRIEAAAILGLVDRVDGNFERAVQLLFDCRGRVIVTGMGKSGIICRKIAATLSSTGTAAWFLHPAEATHGDLGAIRDDDVVIALSHSGETEELVRLLESIRRLGARLIAITGDPALDAGQGRRRHARLLHRRRSLPDEPRADGQHDRRPGDGRRAGDDAPRPQGIPRGSVRFAASRRKARPPADAGRERHGQRRRRSDRADDDADAGCLSRDVEQAARHDRRHRRRRPARRRLHRWRPAPAHEPSANVLALTAGEAMTPNPITIGRGLLAVEALKIMETHKITSVIVTDARGAVDGVVHLHDLWRLQMF